MKQDYQIWNILHDGALIFLLMSLFLYSSSLALMEDGTTNKPWGSFVVAMLLFVGSGYLMLRVVFSKRRKPSPRAILLTGSILGGNTSRLRRRTAYTTFRCAPAAGY